MTSCSRQGGDNCTPLHLSWLVLYQKCNDDYGYLRTCDIYLSRVPSKTYFHTNKTTNKTCKRKVLEAETNSAVWAIILTQCHACCG